MIAVIKTPYSNTTSVRAALDRLGVENYSVEVPSEVTRVTTKLILPGVGNAGALMEHLQRTGWDSFLLKTRLPYLGICLGFQILFDFLEEGKVRGLGIMRGDVVKLPVKPLPHMGWSKEKNSKEYYYFVHSYGIMSSPEGTHFLEGTASVVTRARKGNFQGTQFHPERSGLAGEKFMKEYVCE